VPERTFLSIHGQSAPNEPGFQDAIHALYAVGAALARRIGPSEEAHREAQPLEALWWWGHSDAFPRDPEKGWRWRLLLPTDPRIDLRSMKSARAQAQAAHPELDIGRVELWRFAEGTSFQILHVGAYKEEGSAAQRLQQDVLAAGFEPTGLHHEIYLSDPRRTKPGEVKTILRQPVKRSHSLRRGASREVSARP
jgi:hypothetical protein